MTLQIISNDIASKKNEKWTSAYSQLDLIS